MDSLSDQAERKKITQNEDKYPIIWFLDLQENMTLTTPIQVNSSVHIFEKSKDEVVKFAQTLGKSFLLIISRSGLNEEKLLKDLRSLENTYERRLTDFEKVSALKEISVERSDRNTNDFGIYVFYTRGDFESEILRNEDIEKIMEKYNIKEDAKVFREEFIFWERKRKGLENADAVFQDSTQGLEVPFEEADSTECKEFCITRLKELVSKRNHEKEKIIYYVNLGESCQKLGEDRKALEYLGKALEILKSMYGEVHPSVAKLYNCISNVYYCTDQFKKALDCDVNILKIRKSLYGENHWLVASSYYNMALVFDLMKEFQKSIEHHLKAFHIYKALYGEMHPYISLVYQAIGDIHRQLGDFTKASQYFQKGLDIYKFIHRGAPSQDLRIKIAHLKHHLRECQNVRDAEIKNVDISL